jgi:hypothetical protein
MRRIILATVAACALSAGLAMPAAAQVATPRTAVNIAAAQDQGLVTNVRWRGRHWRHRGHWRHRHWRGGGWGPGFGIGLGTGLLFGGLAASAQANGSAIDWCDQHYRSYDRGSQTYLGYDGYRHSCP